MIDLFKYYINLFNDKSTSLSKKISYLIVLIALISITESHFDFSYNYFLNNKLEQLKIINDLKITYKNDLIQFKKLESLENEIIEKEHYSFFLKNVYIKSLNFISKYSNKVETVPKIKKEITKINKPLRSVFWMTLSSNYFLILTFIIAIFLPVSKDEHRKGSGLIGLVAGLIIISIFIFIITLISYQIPLIYNKPYLNYILNVLIHFGFLFGIFKLSKK